MPLTVGHRDSPIPSEVKYIKTVWKLAHFLKADYESEESAADVGGTAPAVATRSASAVSETQVDKDLDLLCCREIKPPGESARSTRGEWG